ncbi:MAG TPA: hypothetical protein VLL52_25265 [Anaerolineae bacterium]|nr:hypothetical protein [Anaerolineae bacterium]
MKKMKRTMVLLLWSILLGCGLWWGRTILYADSGQGSERLSSYVVVRGDDLGSWVGTPISDLVAYAYVDNSWQAIPFQVDEVTVTGTYTVFEDGLLDENDELVWMQGDGGERAPAEAWPADSGAQLGGRQLITVTDPLSTTGVSWVYWYRSSGLERSEARYVNWDEAGQGVTAVNYTLELSPTSFIGLANLRINGQASDILDRQKIRGQGQVFVLGFPGPVVDFNEETILELVGTEVTTTLPLVGPIRGIGGNETQSVAFYGNEILINVALPVEPVPVTGGTFVFNWIETAFDWRDPAVSGMAPMVYYDSNTVAGVSVDGVADGVVSEPLPTWWEISGAQGGVAVLAETSIETGVMTHHYVDNGVFDEDDTGDGYAFGEVGVRVDEPEGVLLLNQRLLVAPAGLGSIGEDYGAWVAAGWETVVVEEVYESGFSEVYLPLVVAVGEGANLVMESVAPTALVARPADPVIVSGADLPAFVGEPIADLRLYADINGSLSPIPFQVDEVMSTGVYTATGGDDDDGGLALFDSNDELVFMAFDGGEVVDCGVSTAVVGDSHSRHEIAIQDPLDGMALSYAYLYTETVLTVSGASYINWDEGVQRGTTVSYTVQFGAASGTPFVGVDRLQVGGVELLDRQKLQLEAEVDFGFGCGFTAPLTVNEETVVTTLGIDPTIRFATTGPVRAVNGTVGNASSLYQALFETSLELAPTAPICDVSLVRTSFDWLNGEVSDYRDGNGGTAVIDGIGGGEGIDGSNVTDWYQVEGDGGGFVLAVKELVPGAGSAATYYTDDASCGGTGDEPGCYGETGLAISNSGLQAVSLSLGSYILDADDGLGGQDYANWSANPLTTTVTGEYCTVCLTPAAVEIVSGTAVVGGIDLSWVVTDADGYELWWSDSDPYFEAGIDCNSPGSLGCEVVMGSGYSDTMMSGMRFYDVVSFNSCGTREGGAGGRVGGFEYSVVVGG